MHQLIATMTPRTYKHVLQDALHSLEDATGMAVKSYRAPGFSLTNETLWAFEILAECGIENDCSIFPAHRSPGGFPTFHVNGPALIKTPSGQIKEFPVNYFTLFGRKYVFSGGGYFRLLPYPVIRNLTSKSDYLMSYLHPRDFDPGQPRVPGLSRLRTFKSYVGIKGAEKKLNRWLDEFEFTDLRQAIKETDWTTVPVFIPDVKQKELTLISTTVSSAKGTVVTGMGNTLQIMGFNVQTGMDSTIASINSNRNPEGNNKIMINCLNPHSYCESKKDVLFREALLNSDILIPDGVGIVIAAWLLKHKRIHKVAGTDVYEYLLKRLNEEHGACFYLGSSQKTLNLIRDRLANEYPNITARFYSPVFKKEFTEEESQLMVNAVNSKNSYSPPHQFTSSPPHHFTTSPVLFIGMTAPKQEKWSYQHIEELDVAIICNIGAAFDFYAGTVKRASPFMIKIGFEWLSRFIREPKRMYRRVLISGPLFLWDVVLYRLGVK
jgi:N-acetylglucosaminyldiphosphoundecaprenol N-acetyl-beta-D-mannosaminyltransferase